MARITSLHINPISGAHGHCRLPEWVRRPPGSVALARNTKLKLREVGARTVCEEARCPNIAECFGNNTSAFMILGTVCTRHCKFCSVNHGVPLHNIEDMKRDAQSVANAAFLLGLEHIVVTSVTRDDLPDGGASGFVMAIDAIRAKLPNVIVEVLIPDFNGNVEALDSVLLAAPDILNHNLETIPRLYSTVRPEADFKRSLALLERAAGYCESIDGHKCVVKTGFMCGMGETQDEMVDAMRLAYESGVTVCTLGQYLQPTRNNLPVSAYINPKQFEVYQQIGESIGFDIVYAGALVRSSYHAAKVDSQRRMKLMDLTPHGLRQESEGKRGRCCEPVF